MQCVYLCLLCALCGVSSHSEELRLFGSLCVLPLRSVKIITEKTYRFLMLLVSINAIHITMAEKINLA